MASALDELRAYTEALRGVAKSARDLDELLHNVDANLTPVVEKLEKFSEVMSKATASRAGWLFVGAAAGAFAGVYLALWLWFEIITKELQK